MKTIYDVEKLVKEYMERHELRYQRFTNVYGVITVECFCLTRLEAKLTKIESH